MNECVACHVDYRNNADARVFSSGRCEHCICEPCIPRLFSRGRQSPCPACGVSIRAEDFSSQQRDVVESEVLVRSQLDDAFNKTDEDFRDAKDYQAYGDIWKLVNSPSPQEFQRRELQENMWHIDKFADENVEQNAQAQCLQRRSKSQKILGIIAEDGVFGGHVSADWSARYESPLQPRYECLFTHSHLDAMIEPFQIAEQSPFPAQSSFPPSPFDYGLTDIPRHMSGGGQTPDTEFKKARHFFMADLMAAANTRIATKD